MLFVHEIHKVVGKRADEFEDAYRTEWLPLLAKGDDARLLWYFDLAHGSGLSYRAVTVTAVADGAAWGRLADRVARGDLRSWARRLDALQHESRGRVMTMLGWSPSIGSLEEIPSVPTEHEPTMYMEDTMWTFPGKLHDYIEAAGAIYQPTIHADDSRVRLKIRARPADPARRGTLAGGDPSPAHQQPRPFGPPAHPRPPGGVHPTRLLDARRPRTPRPVAEPAVALGSVVTSAMRTHAEDARTRGAR